MSRGAETASPVVFSWRRFREHLTGILHLDEEPAHLAISMAVGMFIGITPFYGLHTLLAIVAAFLFRLNKAATLTGAWINLPWFAPFVYGFSFKLGEGVLAGDFSGLSWASLSAIAGSYLRASAREQAGSFLHILWNLLFVASTPLFVGTTLVGLVLGAVTYFVTFEAILNVRRLRHRAHPPPADVEAGPGSGRGRGA